MLDSSFNPDKMPLERNELSSIDSGRKMKNEEWRMEEKRQNPVKDKSYALPCVL
jgi:hypothetical protein